MSSDLIVIPKAIDGVTSLRPEIDTIDCVASDWNSVDPNSADMRSWILETSISLPENFQISDMRIECGIVKIAGIGSRLP